MILTNASIATMQGEHDYGMIRNGAIVIAGSKLVWVGAVATLPAEFAMHERIDLEGRLVTPGLIDCHTHLVFGGDRAAEFELRLKGASYQEIARAGGGIMSTVVATRAASQEQLLAEALTRVDALIAEGVSTVEIKSGYGLDIDTEMKMLRVARQIAHLRPIRVLTSFLGAHTVPQEYKLRADEYLNEVCLPALKAANDAALVDCVDGFCETIAFSVQQMERVFQVAQSLGLPVKLHAEQLSRLGGTQLAARYQALSADHLEYANSEDARALAQSGAVAVLLPGAFYTLREKQLPPIDSFRAHQVPMAVATDCNPGSSPLCSLLLAMNMGCTLFQLTAAESLAGVTVHAARALGLSDSGAISCGQRADLAIWNVRHPAELAYRIGFNPLWKRIYLGDFG
jgi:imidazolonepropionase